MRQDSLERAVQEYIESVKRKAQAIKEEVDKEIAEEAKMDVARRISPSAKRLIRQGFHNAVAAWYSAYIPKKYKRSRPGSLYAVLEFDSDPEDGIASWGYYDDGLEKPSIYINQDTGLPYATYNIYDMAMIRGSHGNRLPGYDPVITDSPLDLFKRAKPGIEAALVPEATRYAQEYYDKNYKQRFYRKFNSQ